MDELLLQLLNRLDAIGAIHEELYDTECREQTGGAIMDGFVRNVNGYRLPEDFLLYTPEGNRLVREALHEYITAANAKAANLGLLAFHDRLAAFQNNNVRSQREQNFYDDFFGWSPPEAYDAWGNVIRQI